MKLKEAKYYKMLPDKKVLCFACYRSCIIEDNKLGFCNVRKNVKGKLYSLVYGRPVAINIDPIEKKPIYNFMSGTYTLSLGTAGCNFDCPFCQNYSISKANNININQKYISPREIVDMAIENNLPSISYTYTEPTIFMEYALDIMKLAKEKGLANIWVSNGYMQKEVMEDLLPYLDAINIDLKGDRDFYKTLINNIDINRVKENIRFFYKNGVHVEITNLLIENYNTTRKQIEELVDFVASVGKDIPLHFSASFGAYKMLDIVPTKIKTLYLARDIAIGKGLKYVYLGNI